MLGFWCQEQPPAHGEGNFEVKRGGRDSWCYFGEDLSFPVCRYPLPDL